MLTNKHHLSNCATTGDKYHTLHSSIEPLSDQRLAQQEIQNPDIQNTVIIIPALTHVTANNHFGKHSGT